MKPASPADELQALRDAGLLRTLRSVESVGAGRGIIDGREVALFAANDYLGLAAHPAVRAAAVEAVARHGWGSGSARTLGGTRGEHLELEAELAAFKHTEAALITPAGYQANLAALGAIAGPDDCVFLDKLNHAGLIDAARLSGARVRVFPHNDMAKLEELLAGAAAFRRRVIAVDGLFSMDGDAARLPDIVALARRFHAVTLVDDAHGTGVLGEHGRGTAEHFGVEPEIDLVVGTLSKALGGLGGFVCGSRNWVDLVLNRGRQFLFTTAPPAAQAAAARAALRVLIAEPQRRRRLHALAGRVREAVAAWSPTPADTPPGSPITPLIVGSARAATEASDRLLARGLYVPAVRPPTVAEGTARLRISVSADHRDEDVDLLLAALADLFAAPPPGINEPQA